ncbi:MAG TPA: 4Fe-4S dicluster domain-containing protein, partial [Rhodocyclaceae bacterium]
APFVEIEWGREATAIMRELKALLDPDGLLNPGVVLNEDPTVHLKNLKPMPAADAIVDACIECGFCETQCPSAALTFSPRQRIVATRDFARRAANPAEAPLSGAVETYRYMGMDTCAGCGLCSTVCPVGINTGQLIRSQRGRDASGTTRFIGRTAARHFSTTATFARLGVAAGRAASAVVGDSALSRITGGRWKAGLRPGTTPPVCSMGGDGARRVVYFAGCAGRMMGDSGKPLSAAVIDTCQRAGFEVIQPKELGGLCCGQPWESKGLFDDARDKANELEAALAEASERGRWPIVFDASACALRMREHIAGRLPIVDFPVFAADQLLPRLAIRRQKPAIALHLNCSSRRMGDQNKVMACASACAEKVVVPPDVKCCGFGGDRGFAVPELNAHALRTLTPDLLKGCEAGYSSNRTCEIGLTDRTGIPYRSLAHLLDECTEERS